MAKDRDYELFYPNVSPSGAFVQNYQTLPIREYDPTPSPPERFGEEPWFGQLRVRNPMPVEVNTEIVDRAIGIDSDRLYQDISKAQKMKVLHRSDFDDFGNIIFKVALDMQMGRPDLYLFPLRGGRQPGIQLRVINDVSKDRTIVFNYTQNSNVARQPVIREDIRKQLEEQIKDGDHLKLAILDTAVGGQGSFNLAKRLLEVHGQHFSRMKWEVRFYLLHKRGRVPSGKIQIEQQSTNSMKFTVYYYPVDDLIIEDWDAGIGLSAHGHGEHLELKPLKSPGKVAIRDRDTVTVIQSDDVSTLISQAITDSINESMLSDETLEFVGNVQQERDDEIDQGK